MVLDLRRLRLQLSMHRLLRGDGSELFVRHGSGVELKCDCGLPSAWRRTAAALPAIGGPACV